MPAERAQGGVAVLIVAAGRGERAGGDVPKQYQVAGGRTILAHTLRCFASLGPVCVVIDPAHRTLYDAATAEAAAHGLDLLPPVAGGATRQDSVRAGLEALAEHRPAKVLIHDAARPYVGPDVIGRVIAALDAQAAAIAAVPVTDTLKQGREVVTGTVPRDGLWRAQTPQGFRFDDILAAHRGAAGLGLTDDAAVAEHAGLAVALVLGAEDNDKVTTADDLIRAQGRLGPSRVRVGTGYDVHRLGPGDGVMLCGIHVPHSGGLVGHSDADVGLHALVDAILGGLGQGDIGQHFPPSNPRWKGADSAQFLEHAGHLVTQAGGVIDHLDVTLICERPKVGPHREAMRQRIAQILGLDVAQVSVKATTTEGLGFTGREEGIAAQAAATLRLP
ncbi:bifunctional 2-C-methyl-D-erythritol 4-phosphate cytidylyltransferase/2-C-methyl-D-erythritol 2,4-cyclodiphosphate synthase [Zavarzinia sp. CC-PAN008]|uniref:bifunctional 2-C-methyl-D-erythritol 4-phosphate cytidylyltransferase/2-C-methyl-D-erythritol 2,4-cyclodiphosphate synthase n=1 Tax=Zavarzinia sp. CC-PAN008 TaxID=3243332 RepID=UPI003F749934